MENETRQPPPIQYPTITIPGRGSFVVKFDLLAEYILDNECGMDANGLAQKLQEWMPKDSGRVDAEGKPVMIPGRASPAFMLKVLSACVWEEAHMTPEELAKAFRYPMELNHVAQVLLEAFAKTEWSAQIRLQETATPAQGPLPS